MRIVASFVAKPNVSVKRSVYVDEKSIVAPSVITLNAVGASQAANYFLFYMTGLTSPDASRGYQRLMRVGEPWP